MDFDQDGLADIVVAAFDGNVYVFKGDGSILPGFPVRAHSSSAYRFDRIMSTPVVTDLNEDGIPDILVGSNETIGDDGDVGFYFAIDGRGTNAPAGPSLPNWPVEVGATYFGPITGTGTTASPAVLSLGGPGSVDALLQTNGSPLVIPADPGPQSGATPPGTLLPAPDGGTAGFAAPNVFGSLSVAASDTILPLLSHPSVGDLDQDGVPDVVMTGEGESVETSLGAKTAVPFQHLLGMWSGKTGQPMPGSPVVLEDYSFMTGQAIADITGDGYPEVIAGTGGYFVHAVDACGREASGWPKFTGGWTMGTPAVGDVTGAGHLDVVATTREGNLYAWSTRVAAMTTVVQWESFHRDNQNTGVYGAQLDQGVLLTASAPLDCSDLGDGSASSGSHVSSSPEGCGCSLAPTSLGASPAGLGLSALALAWRRRRRRVG
jgi:MYXO-CTERM domain-containing protein